MSIKVSGTTEVARKLYVFVNSFGGVLSPEFDGGSRSPTARVSRRILSGEYSYTPTSSQTYTVCGYVDENEFATPMRRAAHLHKRHAQNASGTG